MSDFRSSQIKKTINKTPKIVPNPVKTKNIPKKNQNLFKKIFPLISF